MKKADYTGRRFELLKVIGFDYELNKWKCQCQCGNTVFYTSRQIQVNRPKSCGCLRSPDLTGKTFGRLKVINKTDKRDDNYNIYYLCECKCGKTKLVTATQLIKDSVRSCGCLATENNKNIGKIIGQKTVDQCVENTNIRNLTMKISKSNKSGVKGVCWDKRRHKWVAQIGFQKKHYYLGAYDYIEDAAGVRKIAEDKLFGEFLEWYNTYIDSKKTTPEE